MPLMEKAYAKMNVDYLNLAGGRGVEGLRSLTGKPSGMIYPKKFKTDDAFWEHLKPIVDKNYPMVYSCCSTGKSEKGLYTSHAYTFLNLVTLSTG